MTTEPNNSALELELWRSYCRIKYPLCGSCLETCVQRLLAISTFTKTQSDTIHNRTDEWRFHNTQAIIHRFIVIAFPLLSSLGVIGNFIVIFVILRLKELRKLYTNLFLINMAIADLAVCLFCVNMTMIEYLNGFLLRQLGVAVCRLNFFLQSCFYAASVLLLLLISLERYIAISHPLRVHRILSRKVYLGLLLAIWMLSVVLGLPNLFIYRYSVGEPCNTIRHFNRGHLHYAHFVALYVAPLLAMALLYSCTCRALARSMRQLDTPVAITAATTSSRFSLQQDQPHQHTSSSRHSLSMLLRRQRRPSIVSAADRRKVIRMLIVIVLLFGLCRLPRHLWGFIYFSRRRQNLPLPFGLAFPPLSFFCYYLSSALNPFVYFLFSRSIRDSVRLVIFRAVFYKRGHRSAAACVAAATTSDRTMEPMHNDVTLRRHSCAVAGKQL